MKNLIILMLIVLVFSSCLKERSQREVEDQRILNYIYDLGLDFDTTRSGAIYHITYKGEGENFQTTDKVPLVYSGFYFSSDKEVYFVENDTFNLTIGDRRILDGWSEILPFFAEGGSGILIFPYYIAFGVEQTPNIPSNSTLYYRFKIATDNYWLNQNALFWQYAEQYDSISTIYDDSLCYVKYFDGLGPSIGTNDAYIDYFLSDIYDTIRVSSSNYLASSSNPNLTTGLLNGLSNMCEGEMGLIIVPPSQAYIEDNIYDIPPHSALVYEIRAISSDPEIEEKSKIDKYLYLNQESPDSILPSGIYYFIDNPSDIEDAIKPNYNSTISYSDSLCIINNDNHIESCQNCGAVLNSTYFIDAQIECLSIMREGESATFIIPYSEGYGADGTDEVPPYSTLLYKVDLISVD